MEPDLHELDAYLDGESADGYLISADGTDSDQRYVAGFGAPDPFESLYRDGAVHLLVSGLEYGRARKESRAASVSRLSEYDYRERVSEYGQTEGKARVVADFLADHGCDGVAVPGDFPTAMTDALRARDIAVTPETNQLVMSIRATKTDEEVDHIRRAQRANELAMERAETLVREADVVDGTLHRDGEPLTSEDVKTEIEIELLRQGCALDETIVACGADGADPHDRGSGPLEADELVVVDIFPQDKETKYHADMTRTFCKGEPTEEMRRRHRVTDEAREAALDVVEPGVTGEAVHDAVCDVYEDAGYPTLRSDESTETGFIHSTGHGVGLDVHELPRAAPNGGELEAGHVVTVEPGLYDPAVGGVRIEDLVVVTEDGYENLTEYHYDLVVE